MSDRKTWRIEQLFAEKSAAVQAFFRRRLRPGLASEAPDLTQEVYSRLLNAGQQRAIQDPEAYLFTIARHLLEEHAVAERRRSQRIDFSDAVAAASSIELGIDSEIDRDSLSPLLDDALRELSPPCRAAVVMAYYEGLSYREIAERLGVSKPMIQKYLAQAISHCRRRLLRRPLNRKGVRG
jgi:RNA polymerase sigma factor (sigma-70 family)